MRTRLYHHPIFAEHLTGPGHPERPERMQAVTAALEDEAFQHLDRADMIQKPEIERQPTPEEVGPETAEQAKAKF